MKTKIYSIVAVLFNHMHQLGIVTLICIVITLLIGIFIKKNRNLLLPWHKGLAFLTLILAVLHTIIVMMFR